MNPAAGKQGGWPGLGQARLAAGAAVEQDGRVALGQEPRRRFRQRDLVTLVLAKRQIRRGPPQGAVMRPGPGRDPLRDPGGWIVGALCGSPGGLGLAANEDAQVGSRHSGGLQDDPWGAAWLGGGVVKIAALAIALVAGMALAGPSVTQPPWNCPSGRVCLYEGFAYRGRVFPFLPGTPNLGSANDQASSVFNNAPRAVLLYDYPNYGGSSICLNPDTGINDLALFGWNNAISSIGVEPSGGCG